VCVRVYVCVCVCLCVCVRLCECVRACVSLPASQSMLKQTQPTYTQTRAHTLSLTHKHMHTTRTCPSLAATAARLELQASRITYACAHDLLSTLFVS